MSETDTSFFGGKCSLWEIMAVYLGPFWQDDLELEVVDDHVVVNVVDHPHVEDKVVLAVGEEVLP